MEKEIEIKYSSVAQQRALHQILSGTHRTLKLEGGGGSGKTYISMIGVVLRSMKYDNTIHYLIKTDLKALKTAFETSVIPFLQETLGLKESKSKKRNSSYFYDSQAGVLYLANKSRIQLCPVKSPYPYSPSGDASIQGINGETIYIDEATTLNYQWYEFFETRCRSAHGCPPLLLLTENPDARSWTDKYFREHLDPVTLQPLSDIQIQEQKVMRIESWENNLQNERFLAVLKNSGNALRFYWGKVDNSIDYGQIYQYEVAPFRMRLFNIYAMDIGYKAKTAIVQIGFGGDYSVNIRELCYKSGLLHDDILAEVGKIIEQHNLYLTLIESLLLPGQRDKLLNFHKIPYLIIDCARTDLIDEINKKFNPPIVNGIMRGEKKIEVVPSLKGELKYYSIERSKKLKQIVSPDSKFFLNEINSYRYKENAPDDERVPDGNDDLMDAALYGKRYILEEVYPLHPELLIFNTTLEQLYNQINQSTIWERLFVRKA